VREKADRPGVYISRKIYAGPKPAKIVLPKPADKPLPILRLNITNNGIIVETPPMNKHRRFHFKQ
jgi:hypothetical protein